MTIFSRGLARCVPAVLAALVLVACETTPTGPGGPDPAAAWDAHLRRLEGIDVWTATGRIAVTAPEDAWNARVLWIQDDARYRIRLSGPLGQGAVQLQGGPGEVELRTARKERFVAESPEELLAETIGWEVPLSGLRYWLLGRPQPAVDFADLELDDAGRARRLEQAGWTITYDEYLEVDDVALPSTMAFRNGQVSGKVLVSRWALGRPG